MRFSIQRTALFRTFALRFLIQSDMNILVITGSPHHQGTSALLADEFIRGAREAGHQVSRFDAAQNKRISPCMGCEYCRSNDSQCVFIDDMEIVKPDLLAADAVVFVTPTYYFGMSAQIKTVIDRFYAINEQLRSKPKKALLLVSAADDTEAVADAMKAHFQSICNYLKWENCGALVAFGVYHREDIERTDFPAKAYELGKSFA